MGEEPTPCHCRIARLDLVFSGFLFLCSLSVTIHQGAAILADGLEMANSC